MDDALLPGGESHRHGDGDEPLLHDGDLHRPGGRRREHHAGGVGHVRGSRHDHRRPRGGVGARPRLDAEPGRLAADGSGRGDHHDQDDEDDALRHISRFVQSGPSARPNPRTAGGGSVRAAIISRRMRVGRNRRAVRYVRAADRPNAPVECWWQRGWSNRAGPESRRDDHRSRADRSVDPASRPAPAPAAGTTWRGELVVVRPERVVDTPEDRLARGFTRAASV